VPTWPASSPYVTAVGGTRSSGGKQVAEPQSTGGFSYRWPRPTYQEKSVSAYLEKNGSIPLPQSISFNAKGRAFPDVSAMFEKYQVVTGLFGGTRSMGGTSASTPVVAGIVSLLNDLRLQRGSSTLGFLNPLLYQHPQALNDITDGPDNGACQKASGGHGFPPATGWDGPTGLGEPNYQKMAEVVSATAPLQVVI